jgi:signal transduction histidine kinase
VSSALAAAHPMHELRGALAALDLGLSLVERGQEVAQCSDGLRVQLDRALEALEEIDALRNGEPRRRDAALVDLTAIIGARAVAWSQLAPAYGAAVRFRWRAGRVCLRGDLTDLLQALDNLIGNALEHGGGRVLVDGERRGSRVRITISDGGAGLRVSPKELVEAPESSARGHGLAIARNAVESLGGTISASVSSGSAAVVVELPLELPVEAQPARAASRAA